MILKIYRFTSNLKIITLIFSDISRKFVIKMFIISVRFLYYEEYIRYR